MLSYSLCILKYLDVIMAKLHVRKLLSLKPYDLLNKESSKIWLYQQRTELKTN